ncbi:MAG TPA: lysophospholipid acyltransferase family protein [Vicinamibacterales bacterium]|nr:lysophospholipid acyltransferase family protein [Vicinamibacterales bacterium]
MPGSAASCGRFPIRRGPVSWRCTIASSNASEPLASGELAAERRDAIPRRWTLHGLNNGTIFRATYRGVGALPAWVSYGIGRAGTWLAWRLLTETRAAIADNLRPLFPNESQSALERRARTMLGAYAGDVIDFIRSLRAPDAELRALFEYVPSDAALFFNELAKGKGIILVSGHYGNWEAGGVFLRRITNLPVAVVAMPEADREVDRARREIRELIGADTIHVGQSLDTALQIRRRLAANGIVAFLMDRHVGRDRVEVQFLGRRAHFQRTPALMGFMTGAPLVPSFMERLGPSHFIVRAGVPIVVDRTRPRDEAVQAAAQAFADQLAARVREHPEFWYHFYRYWDAQDVP